MRVIVFGATGMIGQGVLRECLLADEVDAVLSVGRASTGIDHPKLTELAHRDFTDFTTVEDELTGYDATLWCLGISSAGVAEADYTRTTYEYTVAAGHTIAKVNPDSRFVFISGAGTDPAGKRMWARVKGRAENAVFELFPGNGYAVRPGFIQPRFGARSRTFWYRALYVLISPLMPLIRRAWPNAVTTTDRLGRVMIGVAKDGYPRKILAGKDLT